MKSVLDAVLVGVAVAGSAGYALAALGPRALRQRIFGALAAVLAPLAAHTPAFMGLGAMAQRFTNASAAKAKGACGGCDNCGSETTEPASTTPRTAIGAGAATSAAAPGTADRGVAAGNATTPTPEVRVPVSLIGRRR